MGHNYYSQDWEMNNTQRLIYFDTQFESLANEVAMAKGILLSTYLSQIINITTFKEILKEVFNQDASLSSYVEGMKLRDFQLFFERPMIQKIVEANKEKEPERIEEIVPEPRPVEVEQVEKKTRTFFKAKFTEKKTKKVKRTIGYEEVVIVKGRKQKRLRDSKGRFVGRS